MMIRFLLSNSPRRPLAAVAKLAVVVAMTWPSTGRGQAAPNDPPIPADQANQPSVDAPPTPPPDPLAEQVRQLRDKVATLEVALSRTQGGRRPSPAGPGRKMVMGPKADDAPAGQASRVSAKFQNCLQCHQTRPSGPLPASHLEVAGGGGKGTMPSRTGAGLGGPMPASGAGKMGMGMMGGKMGSDKAAAGGQPMQGAMAKPMPDDDDDEMGAMAKPMPDDGMGAMAKPMGDDAMMGMGAMGKAKSMSMGNMSMGSSLPGFAGISHLYHIGAAGFFLDHDDHITLSPDQRKKLNQIKQKAGLGGSSSGRKVDEAEQELWELTASDAPDAGAIQAKVTEIETHRGEQRMKFIRAVGEAAKVLTDEQRQVLAGSAAEADPKPPMAKH